MKKQPPINWILWVLVIICLVNQIGLYYGHGNYSYTWKQKTEEKIDELQEKMNVDRDYFSKMASNMDTKTELIKLRHEIMPSCIVGRKTY